MRDKYKKKMILFSLPFSINQVSLCPSSGGIHTGGDNRKSRPNLTQEARNCQSQKENKQRIVRANSSCSHLQSNQISKQQ